MAKSKKSEANTDELVMDRMPGGDAPDTEAQKGFKVDLNFMDEPKEEEVVFPEEQDIEEVSETELSANNEEAEETSPEEEVETETTEDAEDPAEETVEDADEEAVQQDVQPVEDTSEVADKQKAPMVPKSRLDEVLAKQKALQKQLDEMTKQTQEAQQAAPQYDFAKKEAEYQQLVLDGESEKAIALRTEIRNAEKEQIMFEVQQNTSQNIQQSAQEQALQARAAELEAKYPVFDVNSADHDADLLKEAMDLRDAFIIQGYEGPDALDKAVNLTLLQNKPDLLKPTTADRTVVEMQQKDQKAKTAKKLAASESQPPSMKGQSNSSRSDRPIDLNKLSDDEFSALPAETLRRMRGDFG